MAVYFQPQGKSWLDYVAPIAQQALGGLVQGMFERDSNARNMKIEERKAAEASARKREEDAYRERNTMDFLNKLGALDERERAGMAIGMYDPNMAGNVAHISKAMRPDKTPIQLDLGDQVKSMSFDPSSGEYYNAVYEQLGLNPTRQYEQDAATKRDRERLSTQKEMGKAADWYIDTDATTGEAIRVNKLTGAREPLGYKPLRKVPETTADKQQTVKNLNDVLKTHLNLDNIPLPGHEADVARLYEQINQLIGLNGETEVQPTAGLIQYLKDKGYSDEDIQKALAAR